MYHRTTEILCGAKPIVTFPLVRTREVETTFSPTMQTLGMIVTSNAHRDRPSLMLSIRVSTA